jgi:hypothetical protein
VSAATAAACQQQQHANSSSSTARQLSSSNCSSVHDGKVQAQVLDYSRLPAGGCWHPLLCHVLSVVVALTTVVDVHVLLYCRYHNFITEEEADHIINLVRAFCLVLLAFYGYACSCRCLSAAAATCSCLLEPLLFMLRF